MLARSARRLRAGRLRSRLRSPFRSMFMRVSYYIVSPFSLFLSFASLMFKVLEWLADEAQRSHIGGAWGCALYEHSTFCLFPFWKKRRLAVYEACGMSRKDGTLLKSSTVKNPRLHGHKLYV